MDRLEQIERGYDGIARRSELDRVASLIGDPDEGRAAADYVNALGSDDYLRAFAAVTSRA